MSLPIRRTQAAPWLKDGLWRKAQAAPSLDLRFADNKSLVDSVSGQSLVTFTRASSATYTDSTGTLQTATTNAPRFDHNPKTEESLGLLVEEQRTNLLLNSATLATQSVTVTAVAYTLSFYGTGTVTLSGTSTAGPAVGSGAFPTRTTLTFTPTAGSLTLTVSGSVTSAQLEAGSFPTSYIPTTTAAATRTADVASITGTAFSSWYRQDEGTLFAEFGPYGNGSATKNPGIVQIDNGSTVNRIRIFCGNFITSVYEVTISLVSQAYISSGVLTPSTTNKMSAAYKDNDFARAVNGSAPNADSSGTVPTLSRMLIGTGSAGVTELNGTIRRIAFFPAYLTALQRLTQ
jgi:hypothetical protein